MGEEHVTRGLPADLASVLRDQSVIVPQDAAVFELIAAWAKAPTPTASADVTSPDLDFVRSALSTDAGRVVDDTGRLLLDRAPTVAIGSLSWFSSSLSLFPQSATGWSAAVGKGVPAPRRATGLIRLGRLGGPRDRVQVRQLGR